MATNDDETRAAAESVHWRCFHCDKTFTQSQHKQAREHFGTDEGKMPVCLMRVPGEDGLLAALRRAEANLAEWQEERHPLMMALVSQAADHAAALQREEEKGYARGLKDYTKVEAELDRLRAEVAAAREADARAVNLDDLAGHTPGPWKAFCRDTGYVEGEPWSEDRFLQWDIEGPEEPDGRGQFFEKDARLVAAAPDLLAEVRSLRAANAELAAHLRFAVKLLKGIVGYPAQVEAMEAALARHDAGKGGAAS